MSARSVVLTLFVGTVGAIFSIAPALAAHDLYRRVSAGAINGNGSFPANFAGLSADGARVFFSTTEQLVSADTDSSRDIYERSAGVTQRVSAGTVQGNNAVPADFACASTDGTRVFFTTAEPLDADDDDLDNDVYERLNGVTHMVTVGDGAFDAQFKSCSASGKTVIFETAEKILIDDKDSFTDVYGAYAE